MTQPAADFHGFLVIDKPAGLTSRDVVDRVQRWFPRRTRIGHAGTLDPLATGVLPIAVGFATRLIEYVQRWNKCYEAGIRLDGRSDTDDADGAVTPVHVKEAPERTAVERALSCFIGEIEQVPPAYSAAKVTGRRAYDIARKGQEVALTPRRVRIERIDITAYDYPRLDIEVLCGKGTYIRSLARDLGERLRCGGYIERLRRLWVGSFNTEGAVNLDVDGETAQGKLLPPEAALQTFPRINLYGESVARLRHGGMVSINQDLQWLIDDQEHEVAVFDDHGRLVLVAIVDCERKLLRPDKVLPMPDEPER